MPFVSPSQTSSTQARNALSSAASSRAAEDSEGAFERMLNNAVASASAEEEKSLGPASGIKTDEEREEEALDAERQNLPPGLAGLAANIAASPNQLAWEGTTSAADAQESQMAAASLTSGMSAATTGVVDIDAALNAMQAAGIMPLLQEPPAAKAGIIDERAMAQPALAADVASLQNMLMAARQMTATANVTAPIANAGTFTLNAAMPAMRVQLLEMAEDGASHTKLTTTASDGAALGIDLKLDGHGNATLVLDVANDAEHMRLQQTLSALHAGFEAMGLALNVELRQGSQDSESTPTPETNRRASMLRAVEEGTTVPVSRMRTSDLAAAGTQIHFYA
jgi:hypothetical protein